MSARNPGLTALRAVWLPAAAAVLAAGVAGGLTRAGIVLPGAAGAAWLGRAVLDHAALMIGFLGIVIGVERAVAIKRPAAFAAPAAAAFAAVSLLAGYPRWGAWLLVAAGAAFAAASLAIVRRQPAFHTRLMLVAALAWDAGSLLFAFGARVGAVLPWWFAFLALTIAAERLELARLARPAAAARATLPVITGALLGGAAISGVAPVAGGTLYGCGLVLLAIWLGVFDIARRTVLAHGLSRYMAACLLGGYAWLAVAGVAWSAAAWGLPVRDAALHALGLGFVFSMVMGHAPVILPAVARVKVSFSRGFYVPLGVLHLSLVLRLGPGAFAPNARAAGALLNAVAIFLFAGVLVRAATRSGGAPRQG